MLSDDADPMVTVMKLEKAPKESYADIGGLESQIQEIKVIIYHNYITDFYYCFSAFNTSFLGVNFR